MRIIFSRFLSWCLGSKDEPFQYLHHAALLIGSLIYCYFGIANYLYDLTNMAVVISQFITCPVILLLWYFSRWRGMYRSMCIIYVVLVVFVSLPINWFGNGGSTGPTYFINLGILIYISVAFRDFGVYRVIGQLSAILIPVPLIIIEHHYPQLVYRYPTDDLRMFDMSISFVVAGLFFMWMMTVYSSRLKTLSEQDSLTGLYNRRVLERTVKEWQQQGKVYCLALLDIDYFKQINDDYGHNYGDYVLRVFAGILDRTANRLNGLAIRQGGEEFVLLLPLTLKEARLQLAIVAEETCKTKFDHGMTTFSAGIVEGNADETQQQLLKRADDFLYKAKRSGRDRVVGE